MPTIPSSPDGKVDKAEVNYRPGSDLQACKNCEHFIPNSSCTKVEGRIELMGLCDLFQEPMDQDELMKEMF